MRMRMREALALGSATGVLAAGIGWDGATGPLGLMAVALLGALLGAGVAAALRDALARPRRAVVALALALPASGLPARLIGVPAAGALPGLLAPGLLIILVRRPEVRAALPLPTWARLRTRAALGGAAMALNGLAALGAVVASP